MKEKIKENRTLAELILGIFLFGVVCQIIISIVGIWYKPFIQQFFYYSLGLWIGEVLAVIYAFHINRSINIALDQDSDTASKLMRKDSIIRYVALTLILAGLMLTNLVSPLTAFLGVMGLKAGAYMHGLCYKIMVIFIGEEPKKPLIQFDENGDPLPDVEETEEAQ